MFSDIKSISQETDTYLYKNMNYISLEHYSQPS